MEIKIFETEEALANYAADLFEETILRKPDCVLGLATGASPEPTYAELVRRYTQGRISFAQVTTFNLDEYCGLPRDDKNSYYSFMQAHLFSHIDIPADHIHIENGNAEDYEEEAKAYDAQILASGGIDLQLLGIGTNGHIGFNEPADAFTEHTFRIKLSDSTIAANSRYFTDSKIPEYALTMGVAGIMMAKKIVLIATGSKKAQAIKDTASGPISPRCPASVLRLHRDAVLLLDREAASLL